MTREDIAGIFEPCVQDIINAVGEQLGEVAHQIQVMSINPSSDLLPVLTPNSPFV
jgi:hypothetical protein